MKIKLSNGTEVELKSFIEENQDAVYFNVDGFEIDPEDIGTDMVSVNDFPILVWENEEESVDDDGARSIGCIDPPVYHVDRDMLPDCGFGIDLDEFCEALAEVIDHQYLIVPCDSADNSEFKQNGYRVTIEEWNSALEEVTK